MRNCRQVAGLHLFVSVHPSLSLICLSSSLPTSSRAHTHKPKPPDRKYGLGSQRGFLIQTSPVEQPEVAAPTPLPLVLSFQPPPRSFFPPLSISVVCPRMSWQHVRTRTHLGCTQVHIHPPVSRDFGQLTRVFCDVLQTRKACVCERACVEE